MRRGWSKGQAKSLGATELEGQLAECRSIRAMAFTAGRIRPGNGLKRMPLEKRDRRKVWQQGFSQKKQ